MYPILTIAIPTYNRELLLRRLLTHLYDYIDNEIEVIVVDNCSSDNTEQMILSSFPKINFYKNSKNIGPDANFLNCYRYANGQYIWLVGSDDVVTDNAPLHIVDFIKNHDNIDLLFLNHVSFSGEFDNDVLKARSFFYEKCGDYVTTDKNEFIRRAKYQLSYMSSFVLSKKSFNLVKEPNAYIGTSFIHTCIAFEASKLKKTKFGVLFYPCIAQDVTPSNSPMSCNPYRHFEVFGKLERAVFEIIAPKFGFDKFYLLKEHEKFILKSWPIMILSFKANKNAEWRKAFWQVGYPSIKDYQLAKFFVMLSYVIPDFILIFLKKILDFYRCNNK